MQRLTARGRQTVQHLATEHAFSPPAVTHLLLAMAEGGGRMAEFDHREFGGPGIWMHGRMTMLNGLSDSALKTRMDALSCVIAERLAAEADLVEHVPDPPPEERSIAQRRRHALAGHGFRHFAIQKRGSAWWPARLGVPTLSGQQDARRYAWFADIRQLAVHDGRTLRSYDTGDHRLHGLLPPQSGDSASLTFTTTAGPIALDELPLLWETGITGDAAAPGPAAAKDATPAPRGALLDAMERLGELKTRGLLTETEFATKKAELLSRL